MKFYKIFLVLMIPVFPVAAQISQGFDYIHCEMYTTGKKHYSTLLDDPTLKPEACYYLGEIYRLSGKSDSAAYYYEMGLNQETPNALCMAAKAGLIMATDPTQAADLLKKAASGKEYKKNPAVFVAIAKAYAMNKQYDKAFETLNYAKDLNKNYTEIYLTEGDILYQQGKLGEAASKIESAIVFDPNCKTAHVELAKFYYRGKMYVQALEYLDKLKSIDAAFPPALKLYGDIYYEQGKYSKAVEVYALYLQTGEAVLNDHVRYSYALHFNKDFKKSLEELKALIPSNPDKPVLKRLMAYNLNETLEYKYGLETIKDFFNSVKDSGIISSDYKYYAFMLQKDGQDSLAIINFLKAMETSTTPLEFYKEIALSYEKMKKYKEAAAYFKKHVLAGKNIVPADLLYWGRDLYFASGAIDSVAIALDSTRIIEKRNLYLEADSVFGDFSVRYPEHYMGYFWRARVNAVLDPETETGLAKPYYEKVAELLEKTNAAERKKEMIEAYQYLGYYYYLKEDIPNSLIYFNKIIVLEPNNSVAQDAIKGMNQQ